MKKQKQLPKEFTFICDEHSREQLEQLGVDIQNFNLNIIGSIFTVFDKKIIANWGFLDYNLISLPDYLEQEQHEHKWQPLFNYMSKEHGLNLLETDMQEIERIVLEQKKIEELAMLNQELEEVRLKEKEILEKIEELKTK